MTPVEPIETTFSSEADHKNADFDNLINVFRKLGYRCPSSFTTRNGTFMADQHQYVLFLLDEQQYILPLSIIEQVVRAVEITPLPNSPAAILGVIDVHGQIVPVLNLRQQLDLPEQALRTNDHLVIIHPNDRLVAFVVDEVRGIVEPPSHSLIDAKYLFPAITHLKGGIKTEDGLIFIHSMDQLLSVKEEEWLAESLQQAPI